MELCLPKGKIGIGVSGGVDSMVLLSCMKKQGIDILAINIEHGIRGIESSQDSDFVKSFCEQNDIEMLSFRVETLKEREKTKESVELCARRLRYEIFSQILKDKKAEYIALAHHASDNAETILMRILRGTGIKGVRGIVDNEKFIHPLIAYTKEEINAYAEENGIPFTNDKTNFCSDYTRNFLRNEIFSPLKNKFGNIETGFSRLSQSAIECDDFLQSQVLPYEEKDKGYAIALELFSKAHSIIKKYTIAEILSKLGAVQDVEAVHLEEIIALEQKANNASLNLPYGIVALKAYDKLLFYISDKDTYFYEVFDIRKSFEFCKSRYTFENGDKIENGISFDYEKVPKDAVIRTRQTGDIFQRCNGRTKSLSDFLTDTKLTKKERDELLLIAKDEEVFAICGIEISDKIKIDKDTKTIIYIKRSTNDV